MKSRIKEQGSAAHIIIIVVLVLAVLGLLGFVFWQNMNKPVDNKTATTDSTATSETTDKESSSNSKTLTVTEWSVSGTYSAESTIGYTVNQFGSLSISDPSQRSGCEALGSISRGNAGDDAVVGSTYSGKTTKEAYDLGYGDARAQVGEYYYLYTGPQQSCDDAANQEKAVDAVKEFVTNLKAS